MENEQLEIKNRIKIKAFGLLAEIINSPEIEFENIPDTKELMRQLFEKYPILEDLSFSVSVNNEIRPDNVTLSDNTEVALLPPFSGG